ncbi:MAG: Gfo/Idh/MocA family protein [Acidimicrobiales bacterium]
MSGGPRVRVGIVGTGRWVVRHHLPALLANTRASVTAVADPNTDKRRMVQERFGIATGYPSSSELCASGLVDAVIVATPHAAHYEGARVALDAGLSVLLEKPMTLRADEAWDLVRRASRQSVHLVVGYPFHFTSHVAQARTLVASGSIGALRLVTGLLTSPREHLYTASASRRGLSLTEPDPGTYSDPRVSGGGQGQTEVTHALGNMLRVTGDRATSVSAVMLNHGHAVDVVDAMVIEWQSGALGSVASIGTVPSNHEVQREFRYYGEKGFLLHDLRTGALSLHCSGQQAVDYPLPAPEDLYPADAPSACLVDLVAGGSVNPSPGELGAKVVECLEAAYKSAREGGRPVSIDTTDGP